MNLAPSDVARFWVKVDRNGPVHPVLGTRCWIWTAYRKPNGYGGFRCRDDSGQWVMAYAFSNQKRANANFVSDPMSVCHHCDVPWCVNYPDHLFSGTQADNLSDAGAKGHLSRNTTGERNPAAKLTAQAVADIRASKGSVLARLLAKQYGTTERYVYRIWSGHTWKER